MKRPRSGGVATTTHSHHQTKTQTVQSVEVVSCAAAFPISQTKRVKYNQQNDDDDDNNNNNNNDDAKQTSARGSRKKSSSTKLLDWNETVREVQKFGAQGWGAATLRSKSARTNGDNNDTIPKNPVTNAILERKKFRAHQNEQYELLTGRKKKHHAVPLPIVRGIQRKAMAREQRVIQEAKESGIVLPMSSLTATTKLSSKQKEQMKKQQNYKMNQAHGPAPSIGFMKQGMYQVRGHHKNGGGNDSRRKSK